MENSGSFVSLITGAGTGIGQAVAIKLASSGYSLLICDEHTELLSETKKQLENIQANFSLISMDLRDKDCIKESFGKAFKKFGKIDHLVNNAGRPLVKAANEVAWEEWDEVMDVNLKGPYFLSTLFAREAIRTKKPAAIVNIASTHGITGLSGRSVYGISKGGLIQMTRMLAIEWAEFEIRVNAIAPTTVLTPSREASLPPGKKRELAKSRIPLKRFPEVEEIAAGVDYLLSPNAKSITGHTLSIDGGLLSA